MKSNLKAILLSILMAIVYTFANLGLITQASASQASTQPTDARKRQPVSLITIQPNNCGQDCIPPQETKTVKKYLCIQKRITKRKKTNNVVIFTFKTIQKCREVKA